MRQNQQRQAGQQPRRPGGALTLVLALALAAALPRAAAVKGLSPWTSGLITHYGGAQDGEHGVGQWALLAPGRPPLCRRLTAALPCASTQVAQ
jgi:hypothetical protein